MSAFSLAFDVFDKVGKLTERNRPEARGQVGGTVKVKPERYGIMGHRKPAPTAQPEYETYISPDIRPKVI